MPLSEKARIEVYFPDSAKPAYQELLDSLDREFTYTFGGSTIIRGLKGSYLDMLGQRVTDRINVRYTDTPFSLDQNFATLSRYTDQLRDAAFGALEEEAILVVVIKVYHAKATESAR